MLHSFIFIISCGLFELPFIIPQLLSYKCEGLVSFPVPLFVLLRTTNIYTYKTIYNGKN